MQEIVSAFTNPMTGKDVLGLLGQIQHREPIGALILDAQIAQNFTARARLVGALQATLAHAGKTDDLAYAMAEAAVHEVVDTCVCGKCHVLARCLAATSTKCLSATAAPEGGG